MAHFVLNDNKVNGGRKVYLTDELPSCNGQPLLVIDHTAYDPGDMVKCAGPLGPEIRAADYVRARFMGGETPEIASRFMLIYDQLGV